jgi:hypothetical protein
MHLFNGLSRKLVIKIILIKIILINIIFIKINIIPKNMLEEWYMVDLKVEEVKQ